MSHWKNTEIRIGQIKRYNSKTVIFEANWNIPVIDNIIPSCGCTSVKYYPTLRQLKVDYKAGEIPKHISGNSQPIDKKITIVYQDGTSENLFIKGTKIR